MLTEVVLTHPCDTNVHLLAGAWTTPRGRPITHCPGCGEWLGSPFVCVELVYAELGLMLAPVRSRDRRDRLCQLHEDRHSNAVSSSGRAQLRRCRLKSPRGTALRAFLRGLVVPPAGPPAIVGAGVCGALGAAVGEVVQESIGNG